MAVGVVVHEKRAICDLNARLIAARKCFGTKCTSGVGCISVSVRAREKSNSEINLRQLTKSVSSQLPDFLTVGLPGIRVWRRAARRCQRRTDKFVQDR